MNARQFQVIRKSVNRTDKNDARALAFFLSKNILPETRLKSTAESELDSLVATRDVFCKQRTMLLKKTHAMFVRRDTKLKKEGLASKKRLRKLDVSQFTALGLTETLAELDKAIETAGSDLPGHEGISLIKGIGSRSAAILLSGIGNMDDFESVNKLAAYVGIVPKVSQSNETDNRGRITKCGNKLMRTTLVQCPLVAIHYSGYLKAFYKRIKERHGAGKAIVATARKLLSIIYDTLNNGRVFEDFTEFKIQQNQCITWQSS